MGSFINGILAYFKALGFISSRGLSKYFLYSGLIGIILFASSGLLIYKAAPFITNYITGWIPWVDISSNSSIFNWISIILSSVLFISIFKYLMLIFTAPLMSVLSDRVEKELRGEVYVKIKSFSIVAELLRGLRINIRNIIREIFLTLFILILGLIPLFSPVAAILIILVQGYFAGFGNHDFWAERHFSYRNTVRFMKDHKGMLAGNGVVYVFLLAIPILGAFIAPPLATVAATMEGLKELESYD